MLDNFTGSELVAYVILVSVLVLLVGGLGADIVHRRCRKYAPHMRAAPPDQRRVDR